jgi:hypothetical protein
MSLGSVNIETTTLRGAGMKTLRGIIYSCPKIGCHAVLSVGVDPLAVQADTVAELLKALRK